MIPTPPRHLVLLDVYAPLDAAELLGLLGPPGPDGRPTGWAEGTVVHRLSAAGYPGPVPVGEVDWGVLGAALDRLIVGLQAALRGATRPEVAVAGLAPLPAFFALGVSLDTRTTSVWSVNQRREEPARWDVLPFDGAGTGRSGLSPVGNVRGADGAGALGVVLSTLGPELPEQAVRAASPPDVLGVVGLCGAATLDKGNIGSVLRDTSRFLVDVERRFPRRTETGVFLAGPASLALLAGLVLNPNQHLGGARRIVTYEYQGGRYTPALTLPLRRGAALPPFALDLELEIVTPLFLAGAAQDQPELRVPSVRGAMRAWYRALDAAFTEHEVDWFGGADQEVEGRGKDSAQSPFQLRVLPPPSPALAPRADFVLVREDWRRFDRGRPPTKTNGVLYTGYTLLESMGNQRRGFQPTDIQRRSLFTLRLVLPRPAEQDAPGRFGPKAFTAVLGSLWLLGHLGGLGSRSRRGWGSVQLSSVRVRAVARPPAKGALPAEPPRLPPAFQAVLDQLKPATGPTPAAWAQGVGATLRWLRAQFPAPRGGAAAQTAHLGPRTRVQVGRTPQREWAAALNEVGAAFQAFRRDQFQDRRDVGDELLLRQLHPASARGAPLQHAPRRVAFGLPLTFRFGITPARVRQLGVQALHPETVEFSPSEAAPTTPGQGDRKARYTRFPGPVSFRVIRLGANCHWVNLRLDGAPVGTHDPAPKPAPPLVHAAVINDRARLDPELDLPTQGDAIVDEWMNLAAQHGIEVKL